MEKYKDIHQQLESKKNEIMKRVVAIEKDKNKKKGGDPLTANLDEQSLSLENNEVLDALDELSHHELIQINEALVKIAAGTFGYCQTCGDEIAMSRLKAVPYTNLCINCAK
ncbi:MAG: TraR/DksA family transcriptional regulator [Bacteriovoracaceae bacterium]|nr:TraR/DksA family transcriptional regulator [Bacteriovoracaceae bacterium]